jgi:hypothetical protein
VTQRFDFSFEPKVAVASAVFGVTRRTARVELDDLHLTVRFGPWRLLTAVTNIESAELTGPYDWLKVAGPPHLSLADRGVTFATTTRQGLCLKFRRPVAGLLPFGLLRHPGATVTVADPAALLAALPRQAAAASTG